MGTRAEDCFSSLICAHEGKPGVKDEPAVKTEAEEQAAAVGEKRKSGGKEPGELR